MTLSSLQAHPHRAFTSSTVVMAANPGITAGALTAKSSLQCHMQYPAFVSLCYAAKGLQPSPKFFYCYLTITMTICSYGRESFSAVLETAASS